MAQDSAFHDGTTVGDAVSADIWSAPYSSAEYSDFYSKLFAGDSSAGFVIPGYGNNLEVTANSPAAMNILVNTGSAFLRGRVYENTASETLAVAAADPANPRLDVVVLRYTAAAQTIRLAVLSGTPAAVPALPALTQTAAIYEVSLAHIWVASGAASIVSAEVHDDRQFISNMLYGETYDRGNLLKNSEFMAWSGLNTVDMPAITTAYPEGWVAFGNVAISATTKPAEMSRGRAVRAVANSAPGNGTIAQIVLVKPSTTYTFKFLINVNAGDAGYAFITDGATTVEKTIRRTGSYITETIRYTTGVAATYLYLGYGAKNNTDQVDLGQALLAEGFIAGPYRQIHEVILFYYYIKDANWNATAKSTGSTGIDFSADFQGLLLPGTRAVYVRLRANDSGSAAAETWLGFTGSGSTFTTAVRQGILAECLPVNDRPGEAQGWIGIPVVQPPGMAGGGIRAIVQASGVATLDATIAIRGIEV